MEVRPGGPALHLHNRGGGEEKLGWELLNVRTTDADHMSGSNGSTLRISSRVAHGSRRHQWQSAIFFQSKGPDD